MSWWADLATVVGALLALMAALWAFLRWITEPRLRRIIEKSVSPIAQRVAAMESRVSAIERSQGGTTEAIERIGTDIRTGMGDLAASIRELAEKHALTAEEVAFIRGRLDTPRRRTRGAE